jgi:hypothetical protein
MCFLLRQRAPARRTNCNPRGHEKPLARCLTCSDATAEAESERLRIARFVVLHRIVKMAICRQLGDDGGGLACGPRRTAEARGLLCGPRGPDSQFYARRREARHRVRPAPRR